MAAHKDEILLVSFDKEVGHAHLSIHGPIMFLVNQTFLTWVSSVVWYPTVR